MTELATDLFRGLSHLCRNCLVDLTESIREHIISCAEAARLDAEHVRAEARVLHEKSVALRKEAQQLYDAAGVARAEAEAARQKRTQIEKPPAAGMTNEGRPTL